LLALICTLVFSLETNARESVREYLAELARFGMNVSVLVARNGKPILRESTILPIETSYYVASVTKTFTATAIGRLGRQGKLALNDPITRFLKNVPEDKRAITIAQLIHHTSGIGHLYSADSARTRDEAVRAVLATKLVSEPGAEEHYSSDGYVLLAAIVEIASGKTYDRFIAREVFRPAGLRRVAFVGACPKGIARTVAPGLEGSPCELPPILARRGPTGVVANVDDLFRWADSAVRRRVFGDQFDGWETRGTLIGHSGDDDAIGHSAMMFHDTANDRTIVVATNAGEFAGQNVAHVVAQRVLKLLDGAPIVHATLHVDATVQDKHFVEDQAAIDTLIGGPVAGAAEHNRFVAALVEMLREGRTTDIDASLGVKHGDSVRRWWSRLAPRSAAVLGTAPAWWSEEGGTATFLRIEQSNGNRIARVEWSDEGKFRALGGAAIPAPVVLLVRGEEAFDPANGSIVRITR
jgi:hypothetical protein